MSLVFSQVVRKKCQTKPNFMQSSTKGGVCMFVPAADNDVRGK
jgi:hypothetical protein